MMNETILIKFKDGKGDGRMARFVNPDAVLHTDSHITLGGTTIYKSEVDWITYGDPVTGMAGRLDWRQLYRKLFGIASTREL